MLVKTTIVLCALVAAAFGDLTCPDGWTNRLTRCYYFSPEPINNFYGAMQACEDVGGHLVSIESQAERDNIKSYIQSLGAAGAVGYWTSGSNHMADGNFGWFGTGRFFVYKDFCNGNEDGSTNHCVILDPNCSFAWSIVPCESTDYYYVCEKDITRS